MPGLMRRQELLNECVRRLKRDRLRTTPLRMSILEALADADVASTEEDLALRVGAPPDEVSKTLRSLEQCGAVHRIQGAGFILCSHPESSSGTHVLVHCPACERNWEMTTPRGLMAPLVRHVAEATGFRAGGDVLQLVGVCNQCSGRRVRRPKRQPKA